MKRRELVRIGIGATAAALIPSRVLEAQTLVHVGGPLAGSVYHTRDDPGHWVALVAEHVPRIDTAEGPGGTVLVTVTTRHEMDGHRHYIVKHKLLDRDFKVLGQRSFDPERDAAVSKYALLAGYKGPVYALSLCNRHDLWLEGIVV
jgi:superoxide reductase